MGSKVTWGQDRRGSTWYGLVRSAMVRTSFPLKGAQAAPVRYGNEVGAGSEGSGKVRLGGIRYGGLRPGMVKTSHLLKGALKNGRVVRNGSFRSGLLPSGAERPGYVRPVLFWFGSGLLSEGVRFGKAGWSGIWIGMAWRGPVRFGIVRYGSLLLQEEVQAASVWSGSEWKGQFRTCRFGFLRSGLAWSGLLPEGVRKGFHTSSEKGPIRGILCGVRRSGPVGKGLDRFGFLGRGLVCSGTLRRYMVWGSFQKMCGTERHGGVRSNDVRRGSVW